MSARNLKNNRPFIMLMGAQLVSNLGDWLHVLALLTLVGLKWHATPWEITTITLCMALPILIGGPFAGYLSDRMNRKNLMIISDLTRVVIVSGLLFSDHLWQVYVILLLKGLMDTLFSPAKSGKIKEVVPTADMGKAVAISSGIEQITKIAGPAVGGLLVALIGIKGCFIVDAASFLLSAILLIGVPKYSILPKLEEVQGAHVETDSPGKESFWKEMGAGIALLSRMPLLGAGLIMLVILMLILTVADSQTITLFREIPGMNEQFLGYCMAASGAGMLISAVISGKLGGKMLTKMGIGASFMGLVYVLAAVSVTVGFQGVTLYMVLISAFFAAGFGAGITAIPYQTMLQERTPVHLTGRVFGAVNSFSSSAVIIGPLFGGILVTAYGPITAFEISGGIMIIFALILLATKHYIERADEHSLSGISLETNSNMS
ncbi:MFS transporter [Paenibacillus pini]|uniref:MFS transporter n=1 Tax=Paenibacillus pini TaxID=669461 RepID=UPI00056A7641|nr:MFS transporter [Paenibacillus pini]